ncbi:phosphoglycolate phosphatase [Frigidibacter sp. ROC022]|uniref:phosphoglycolate phosphatase n=1 Tax=Frigidibacter sp. ROC022 TaxID=2971796 RepID=UPI00215B33B6|nr:phosphoglycolate phosphatase [Frigidibacter sp. ROC022]
MANDAAPVRGVVFDLDGTLVDSAGDLRDAANLLLAELGKKPIDLETTIGFIGRGVPTLVRRVLGHREVAVEGAELEARTARFLAHYEPRVTASTRPYPGVVAMLEDLQARGIGLALCTNKIESATRSICDVLGLTRFFPVIVGGDTLPQRKPDPAPLLLAIRKLGLEPEEVLYVGDSETDYATARGAQVRFAYFEGGYQRAAIDDFRPDFRLAATADVKGLI